MSDYCEIPEFYSDRVVRASKNHRCCECSYPIPNGERHLYCVGKWDGDLNTYRQHLECWHACMWVRDKVQSGECLYFGELPEWIGQLNPSTTRNWLYRKPRYLMKAAMWRTRRLERQLRKSGAA